MPQKIRIIGVPMDLGQSRRGVDMGPSALRGAGLQARIKQLGHTVEDIGNLEVKQPEEMQVGEKRAKYLQEIGKPSRTWRTRWIRLWRTDFCRSCWVAIIPSRPAWQPGSHRTIAKRKKTSVTFGWMPTAI